MSFEIWQGGVTSIGDGQALYGLGVSHAPPNVNHLIKIASVLSVSGVHSHRFEDTELKFGMKVRPTYRRIFHY